MYKKLSFKKFLSTSLALATAVGISSYTILPLSASSFSDTQGHWGEQGIEIWANYGVVVGYNGKFKPDENITRGDMAVIVNQIMQYQVVGSNVYSDLPSDQYYTQPALKLSAANIMTGYNGKLNPNTGITRQEAAVVLCNALHISYEEVSNTGFSDDASIDTWAKGAIFALKEAGLISGKEHNKFDPTAYFTRAEITTILSSGIGGFYQESGTYSQDATGNVVINTSDVTLRDMTIDGNLIIAEGVASGEAYLNNLTITGEIIVKGGGKNSIYLEDVAVTSVYIDRVDGDSRVVMSGDTQVEMVTLGSLSTVEAVNLSSDGFVSGVVIESGSGSTVNGTFETVAILADNVDTTIQGTITTLNVEGSGGNLTMTDSIVETMSCEGSGVEIHLIGETTIQAIDFSVLATESVLNVGSDTVINMVNVSADGITVAGEGTVESVVAEGNNTNIQTSGTDVTVGEGVSGTTAGDVELESGSSTTTDSSTDTSDSDSSDSSSSDSGSSDSSSSDSGSSDSGSSDSGSSDSGSSDSGSSDSGSSDSGSSDSGSSDSGSSNDDDEEDYVPPTTSTPDPEVTPDPEPEVEEEPEVPEVPSPEPEPEVEEPEVTPTPEPEPEEEYEPEITFTLSESTAFLDLTTNNTTIELVALFTDNTDTSGLTWSSSDPDVATVAQKTSADPTTVEVQGIFSGTATITATLNGYSVSCQVTVSFGTTTSGVQVVVDALASANNLLTIRDDVTDSSIKSALSEYCEPYGYEAEVVSYEALDSDRWEAVIYIYSPADQNDKSDHITITIMKDNLLVPDFDLPEEPGITLNYSELTIGGNSNITLEVSFHGIEETEVVWESSNHEIVNVWEGMLMTGMTAGEVTITATAGDYKATCIVTLSETYYLDQKIAILDSLENHVSIYIDPDSDEEIDWDYQIMNALTSALEGQVNIEVSDVVVVEAADSTTGTASVILKTDGLLGQISSDSIAISFTITDQDPSTVYNLPAYTYFTLSFGIRGGLTLDPVEVMSGETAEMPENPSFEDLIFQHWYKFMEDETVAFDFSTPITEDTHLMAYWLEE